MGVVIDVHVPVSGRARNAIICKFAQINSMQSTVRERERESSAQSLKYLRPPRAKPVANVCKVPGRGSTRRMKRMKHSVQDGEGPTAAEQRERERGQGVGAEHCRFLRPHCRSLVNDMQNITLHPQQPYQQQQLAPDPGEP